MNAVIKLYDEIVNPNLLIRRINVCANHIVDENTISAESACEQLDMFTDYEDKKVKDEEEAIAIEKEKKLSHAMLDIKEKYGKNTILKGMNLQEGATAKQRNNQIGGHKVVMSFNFKRKDILWLK